MRRFALALAVAGSALAPAGATGKILRAQSILPPGQSGHVSLTGLPNGTGSPHLTDQQPLFIGFRWKPALFHQPGTSEVPRAGVAIVRDAFGVPAITGATDADTWWGAGYAVAQDRLFQLELFRRATQGRLAELIGPTRVDDDAIVRQNLYTPAELDQMFRELPAGLRDRFFHYRDGVNAWIARVNSNPTLLPGEFVATASAPVAPWTVRDSVAVGVYLARTIPTNADPESLELANLRGLKQLGPRALERLVPLRTARPATTIPRSEGRFVSQPGRTRKHERAAFRRSQRFAATLPVPLQGLVPGARNPAFASRAGAPAGPSLVPRVGGSYMLAVRRRSDRHAFLYNGPQLGFSIPENLVELELHSPGLHVRGVTAPGAPVIGGGFNRHVAWGITTGASDTDDLYAEKLVPGKPERYVFRGEERQMDCRTERIAYRSPPSDLLSQTVPEVGSVTQRVCRTVHGPVQARAGQTAYARRYAAWGRELETLVGLAALNDARDIREVDAAMRSVTWNENVIAVDSAGSIGYWHPGLFPLRPRNWDERLPYPGTGEAEWRGLLDQRRIPSVINPRQGWLANWNNLPSVGWTAGDGTARKRLDGAYFRVGWLMRLTRRLARNPSFEGVEDVVRQAGTVAQQRPLASARLRRAARGATGDGAIVLSTLLAWDGSYDRRGADGKVDAGVAAWDAFRAAAAEVALRPFGDGADDLASDDGLDLYGGYHKGAPYHFYDATHGEAFGLRTLSPAGYRDAAAVAAAALRKKFGSADPAAWRQPRRLYDGAASGAGVAPALPFFDRGTSEQIVVTGP
jgi:penicillin G amidase